MPLSRLQAVTGTSTRLRDEVLHRLLGEWSGPVARYLEPADLARLLLDLDTPSLLGDSAALVVRAAADYLGKWVDHLLPHVNLPLLAAPCILVVPELDGRSALSKALAKAKLLHEADAPDGKALHGWLVSRLNAHPQGCRGAGDVASGLIEALGGDIDGLLSGIDLLAVWADDQPLAVDGVKALFQGVAEKPIWEFTDALGSGDARKALRQLHAIVDDPRAKAERLMATIISDLRRQIACCETQDDDEANRWTGGRGNLHFVRRRARATGRPALLRLLNGALQLQRQLRSSGGVDAELLMEIFVLHAQKVVRRSA